MENRGYFDLAVARSPEHLWYDDWSPEPARFCTSPLSQNSYLNYRRLPYQPHLVPQQRPDQQPQRQPHEQPHQQLHQQTHRQPHLVPQQRPHQQPLQPQPQPCERVHPQPPQLPHQLAPAAPHRTPHPQAYQAPHQHPHSQHPPQCQYQSVIVKGKAAANKDVLEDRKEDSDLWETQAAFLGPNLWDKTLPYDPDLKVQEYVDLDEFLSENGMPGEALGGAHLGPGAPFPPLPLPAALTKRERSPSPSDCCSPDTINPPLSPADSTFSLASSGRDFDPRTRAFSDEELKPQPMIKKSRKQFVPDDLKDDKYWARRRKNNMAAKRSRDARRMKENQIALRAGYLEKENMGLRQEVELLKKENHILREKLSKCADM